MSTAPFPVVDAPFNSTLRSESSSPRAIVYIDKKPYTPLSYSLDFNGHGSTDTGTAILPLHGNPDWSLQIARNDELKNANIPVYFEVRAGYDGQPLQRRFFGIVDFWQASFEQDIVAATCRSLAAPLIDTKITTPFPTATTTEQFLQAQAACAFRPRPRRECRMITRPNEGRPRRGVRRRGPQLGHLGSDVAVRVV